MKIFLASGSIGRRNLLDEANIKYEKISHNFDEVVHEKFKSVEKYVSFVAKKKLEFLNFENLKELPENFVIISADTMCSFIDGEIIGKPKDFDEARKFFRKMKKDYFYCATALEVIFCKKNEKNFEIIQEFEDISVSKIWVDMNEENIEEYINEKGNSILTYSSGLDVSGFGTKFIKKIEGSYSGIIGLQMCELKIILNNIKKNS